MKLLTIISCFVFLATCSLAYSQSNSNKTDQGNENFMQVQMLINRDLDENYRIISEKSRSLTETQKMFIYDDKKISSGLPFALNLLLGYGVGSWVQGHTAGGLIGTLGNLGGLVIMLSAQDASTAQTGALIYVGTWVVDLILPFTYASSYNKQLKGALGLNPYVDLNIAPSINYARNGQVIPGMALHLGF